MDSRMNLANVSRTTAQIGSILVLLLGVPFLLFAGIQLPFSQAGNLWIFLYPLFLLALLAGLAIAWRKEGLGTAVALGSLVASFALGGGTLPGVGRGQGFSLFVGPINLLFALLMPGYHPEMSPAARWVPALSWLLPAIPTVLFLTSWWLRRPPKSAPS
ncbi:MAG: hypothetical protein HYZ26_01265 [Chloroflexi bacterium]|nr:hypothetical protein [Chloroflexota bacterium]